jgi:hypothetical protein
MTSNAGTEVVRILFPANSVRQDQRLKQNLVEGVVRTLTTEVAVTHRQHLINEVVSVLSDYCVRKRPIKAAKRAAQEAARDQGVPYVDDIPDDNHLCTEVHDLGTNVVMVYDHECLPAAHDFNEFVLNLQRIGRNFRLSA